jgi:hypothetical protein
MKKIMMVKEKKCLGEMYLNCKIYMQFFSIQVFLKLFYNFCV